MSSPGHLQPDGIGIKQHFEVKKIADVYPLLSTSLSGSGAATKS